jgi:hypothetical protein
MRRVLGVVIASSLIVSCVFTSRADAQSRRSDNSTAVESSMHPTSSSERRGKAQVRSYVARRGGYSYSAEDVINTYGDSRSIYGGANNYRDPMLDRQTNFGPFDHGFFFDSGVGVRGGNSPYHH